MALRTGAAPQRGRRSSQLIFGWRARDGELDAYTGQVAELSVWSSGPLTGPVNGRNGSTVLAGHAMPRWEQTAATGNITRLRVEGNVTGQDQERLAYPFPLRVMPLSIYVRAWPIDAPGVALGSNQGLISLGNDPAGGGTMYVYRDGTVWGMTRRKSGSTVSNTIFVEPVGTSYPIELLATLASNGVMQLLSRDALGVLRNSNATSADASLCVLTDLWAGSTLYLATAGSFVNGGNMRLETVKIARGVLSFSQMDLLS